MTYAEIDSKEARNRWLADLESSAQRPPLLLQEAEPSLTLTEGTEILASVAPSSITPGIGVSLEAPAS